MVLEREFFHLFKVFNKNSKQKYVLCPSPLYQIYEGATLLAGGTPYYYEIDKDKDTFIDNLLNTKKTSYQKHKLYLLIRLIIQQENTFP